MKRLEGHSSFWEGISAFKIANGASPNVWELNRTDLRGKFGRLNLRRDYCVLRAGINVGVRLEATLYCFSTDGQSVNLSRTPTPPMPRHQFCAA